MINKLLSMLEILNDYKNSKDTLMLRYVSERLDKSFNEYSRELEQSLRFLSYKHEKSLIKRIKN